MSVSAVTLGLQAATVTSSGLFAGAALYISAVQQPTLVQAHDLDPSFRPPFFRVMYGRATIMQASLAVVSGASALATYALSSDAMPMIVSRLYLFGGMLMLGIPVYTVFVMLPTNNLLKDTPAAMKKGSEWFNEKLAVWDRMHQVRILASSMAFASFIAALVLNQK